MTPTRLTRTSWPTSQIIRLRELLASGASYGYAASQLNSELGLTLSRSAIARKALRLGLTANSIPELRLPTHKPGLSQTELRERKCERARVARARAKPIAVPVTPAKPAPISRDYQIPSTSPISPLSSSTLEQAQSTHGCLWGFGHIPAMTFCGKPRISGGDHRSDAYCKEHLHKAYWKGGPE